MTNNLTTNLTIKPTILSKDNDNAKVTVVDAIMGAGKTSYAIQMMQEAEASQNFIYITPFLDETKRIKEAVTTRNFVTPKNTGKGKLENLKQLILQEKDIASTHALFTSADNELLQLLKASNYTLVLDETVNVLEQLHLNKNDLDLMIQNKMVLIDKTTGQINWNEESQFQNTLYDDIKNMAKSNNLYYFENTVLFWIFDISVFKAFTEVYLLTYLFDGQSQKNYFDYHKVKYDIKGVEQINSRYRLVNHDNKKQYNKEKLKSLITIYDGNLNNIGEDNYSLSKSWFMKNKNENLVKKLQKNTYSFFKNNVSTLSIDNMWTCYKQDKSKLVGAGYKGVKHEEGKPYKPKECFVSCNARATNALAHKKSLAYLINRYENPYTIKFFKTKGIEVNQDLFALSELIQWIFRSQIRNGEAITLYIPSKRMRNLLIDYLDSDL